MQLIATLGDAPVAAIAVVAMLVGLLFAARGPRDKRQASDGEEPAGPTLLGSVQVSSPEVEPGFVGPQGEIVGHGTIRLGSVDPPAPAADVPDWAGGPPADVPVAPAAEVPAAPVADAEPAAPSEPAPRRHMPQGNPFRQGTIKLGGRPAGKPPAD